MMRFSFVLLLVAISVLNSIISNPRLSAAAAVRDIPQEVECGISGSNVTERIIGGEDADPQAWPWQVQFYCSSEHGSFECGGSLVADKWVITAAHCMYARDFKYNANECKVFLGKHYSVASNKVEPAEVITGVEKYFVHEQYNNSLIFLGNDIALLKLNKTVQFDKNIKPICLPFGLPELENTSICYATGWGRDDRNNKKKTAETLKQLQMPIHNDYSYCNFHQYAIEQKICAGNLDRQDDVCQGDSGGPLACREADGKWYLRGVTSFGPEECYSVASFTKVTAFGDWIQEKIASN